MGHRGGAHERQGCDGCGRLGGDGCQQVLKVARHLRHEGRSKEIGGILPGDGQRPGFFAYAQGQIIVEGRLLPRHWLQIEIGQGAGRVHGIAILPGQQDLKQGGVAFVAGQGQGFDHLGKGGILVGIGCQRGLAHARQQIDKGWFPAQVKAQGQRVDKETDQLFQRRMGAVGNGRTDDQIRLPTVAREQQGKSAQDCHVEGCAVGLGECLERLNNRRVHRKGEGGGPIGRAHRSWIAGGQGEQRRRTGQVVAPIGQLCLQECALEPLTLPMGVVGIVNRQGGHLDRLRFPVGGVAFGHLSQQQRDRPAVGDDVVHQDQENCFLRRQLIENGAQERPLGEVKGRLQQRLRVRLGGGFPFGCR